MSISLVETRRFYEHKCSEHKPGESPRGWKVTAVVVDQGIPTWEAGKWYTSASGYESIGDRVSDVRHCPGCGEGLDLVAHG